MQRSIMIDYPSIAIRDICEIFHNVIGHDCSPYIYIRD